MAVSQKGLENPERDLVLANRGDSTAAGELQTLRDRIAEARTLKAPEKASCRHCWEDGAQAAVAAVTAGTAHSDAAAELCRILEQLEAARTIESEGKHWRARWEEGRDAALAVIEGR